ncbi:hypothetical protein ATK36_5933 [Amycolatopsis sulphurea]|uniref:Uncharacterized protein n=1 Tax=Amycolatopsis sulphurea TaxID=76022 RepID=A0A2A9FHQ5_9PSEU|nr:hypothetical protein [Amycolatopsis sulphurea]PFG50688.1 hypothetical protein ATK36_5933 [Amycolatopsis sulphurea]
MSDFVDRLLGRTGSPPVRPIVPTLFEPVAPLRTSAVLPMGTFSESDPPHEPPAPFPAPRPGTVPGTATVFHESRETHETRVDIPAPHKESRPQPQPQPEPVREIIRERLEEHTDPAAPSITVTSVTAPAVPVVAPPAAPAVIPPAASEATPPTVAPPTAEPVYAHPVTRARPRPVAAEPPRPPKVRRRPEPTEPDVHISIGRVEIKAVPAPAPATPPRPGRSRLPVLGLDEYLKERAGGDRG